MLVNDSSLLSTNSSQTIIFRIARTCLTDLCPGNKSLKGRGVRGGGKRSTSTGDRDTWLVSEKSECHDGYIGAKSL